MLEFDSVAVLGAGAMGHGIAQVCAAAGCQVTLYDVSDVLVARGLDRVRDNLDKGVARGKVDAEEAERTLCALSGTSDLELAVEEADLVIEAVPEKLELKRELFARVSAVNDAAVLGTNTSSLSVAGIAAGARKPGLVLGMHFFNPVHLMKLLELVHHTGTSPDVLSRVQAFGARIGKEVITVRDSPGFATSRLGVCLGMEAIRMLQEGVASAADIDTAMVLGYRHPMGPLRLSDLVGLDVRMHIGEYLAKELDNPAFEPPELMRRMVEEGRLGQKTGRGFYEW